MTRKTLKLPVLSGEGHPKGELSDVPGPGHRPQKRTLILVHPPQHGLLEGFSSGLVALANYVAAKLPSVNVQLLDLGLADDDALKAQIQKIVRDTTGLLFVGITTTTASYQAALTVADVFKRLAPRSIVLLGGHHASAQDDVILQRHTDVDFVMRGEAEVALVELLQRYPNVGHVPNLTYRDGLEIKQNKTEAPLLVPEELDQIPPTFQGWGLRSAPGKFDHTTYVSARGCPLRCAFCAVGNATIRAKSVDAVISDLRHLVGERGCRQIAIEDNFFAHSPRRTIELCQAIEELQKEFPFKWDCQTRVESCQREDVLEAMARAGCEAVYLGVEAFAVEHLLYLRKTQAPGSYLRMLRKVVVPWLLRSEIACYINVQLGLPGEGDSHRTETLQALAELGRQATEHDKQITIFPQLHVVYPGTRHFHEGIMEGRFGRDGRNVFEDFTRWEAGQQPILRWLGEHFAHGTGGIPEGILYRDLLREGRFEVNPDAVFEVINYLNAMAEIEGIQVFKYGRYLTQRQQPDGHRVPSGGAIQ
jgi:radical SAM superfamily enzyme YgiQ (UPF0313 family)